MTLPINIYNLPVLIAAALNVSLAAFVFMQRRRSAMHNVFIAWNIALTIWNVGSAGVYGATSAAQAVFWSRFCYHGIVFIPATFLHLVLTLKDDVKPWQWFIARLEYLIGALLLAANYVHPGFLDGEVVKRFWGYWLLGGPGTKILDPMLGGTSLFALILLGQQTRLTQGVRHNQLLYIFWGTVIAFIGGGINVAVIHGANIYPFGNIINIFYSVSVAYAIVSYSWMDIRIVVSRGVAYAFLGSALACMYLTAVYFLEKTLQVHELRWTWELRLVVLAPIFFFWTWLKTRALDAIEKLFWPGAPLYRRQLREMGVVLGSSLDLEKIAATAVRQIPDLLGSTGAAFFLLDPPANCWRLVAASGSIQPAKAVELEQLRPHWFHGTCEQDVMTEELDWRLKTDPRISGQAKELRDWLQKQRAVMSLPVRFQKKLMGLWILGKPAEEQCAEPFSFRTILRDVAGQMGLGAHNAMAVQQIEKEQYARARDREIAAIGTVITEMAHELTKPLTNIMNEGSRLSESAQGSSKRSLTKIEKEVQRAAEILDGFALLSPDRTLHKIPISLSELLDEAIAALGIDEDAGIQVVRRYGNFSPVPVNPGQIVQVLTNVIQNAWHAMENGGIMTITLSETQIENRPAVAISVEDSGPGIPAHLLSKLFEPFFTTKKDQGGRGVGLTLSKAMIDRHQGRIDIDSPIDEQKGTRVRIALPIEKGDST